MRAAALRFGGRGRGVLLQDGKVSRSRRGQDAGDMPSGALGDLAHFGGADHEVIVVFGGIVVVAHAKSDLAGHASAPAVMALIRQVERIGGRVDIVGLGDDAHRGRGHAMEANQQPASLLEVAKEPEVVARH